jgi:hypothetical protein
VILFGKICFVRAYCLSYVILICTKEQQTIFIEKEVTNWSSSLFYDEIEVDWDLHQSMIFILMIIMM